VDAERVVYRTCPLCEASCGLELHLDARDRVVLVRGDRDDVFSGGFLCPKGAALGRLDADPDRVRAPMLRDADGWREVSWPEAWARVAEGLGRVIRQHGRESVGAYLGNPNVHTLSSIVFGRVFLRALATPQVFSASTVDQMPKHVSSGFLFGGGFTVPVPDLDRTELLLVLGANPIESNGSLCTAPDFPGRLDRLRARGGRLVVVDPRRTKTAERADLHLPIVPGTDAHLLFGIVHTLFAESRVDLGVAAPFVASADLEVLRELAAPFTPDAVAAVCGIDAADVVALARDLAATERSVVYGRIGTCVQEFGTLSSWLVDVVNLLVGSLDRPGGAMFTTAAAGSATPPGPARPGRGYRTGRRYSRVRGAPEVQGELPVAALAEEIDTPGAGRIRALVSIAGNPVVSTPDGARLDAALASLDFMVAVDVYVNETTRHADVILPSPSLLAKGHYDLSLLQLAVRNVANWSPPVTAVDDTVDDAEILLRLASIVSGLGPDADPAVLDDLTVATLVDEAIARDGGPLAGRDRDDVLAALAPRRGSARVLDLMLRSGPYGDHFGRRATVEVPTDDGTREIPALTLDELERHPHGIDLGPLQPRLPSVLRTPSGAIELCRDEIVADVRDRLVPSLTRSAVDADHPFLLVGRRDLRSYNSWMHNVEVLVKGRPRCTLHLHPDDAADLGIADGSVARVRSRVGSLEVPVEVTDAVRPGVVSIPHGWGHGLPGTRQRVADAHAGVNVNLLTDGAVLDPLSGNAVLAGVPVAVEASG
jgi:anaerobic selenocysteine-containing dehydrogenase